MFSYQSVIILPKIDKNRIICGLQDPLYILNEIKHANASLNIENALTCGYLCPYISMVFYHQKMDLYAVRSINGKKYSLITTMPVYACDLSKNIIESNIQNYLNRNSIEKYITDIELKSCLYDSCYYGNKIFLIYFIQYNKCKNIKPIANKKYEYWPKDKLIEKYFCFKNQSRKAIDILYEG